MSNAKRTVDLSAAKPLWHVDVSNILSSYAQRYPEQYHSNNNVGVIREYVDNFRVFKSDQDALAAKDLVASFNKEANDLPNGQTPPHSALTDKESSILFTLGIFNIIDAFQVLPSLQDRFGNNPEPLTNLFELLREHAIEM